MLIGYARVSTDDQNVDLQRDALRAACCERTFEDMASGAKAERTGLARLMAMLRAGDTVVIWRLDRLGRSIKNLIDYQAGQAAGEPTPGRPTPTTTMRHSALPALSLGPAPGAHARRHCRTPKGPCGSSR